MDPSTNSPSNIYLVNIYCIPMAVMLWASTQTMLANDIDLSLFHRIKYSSDGID